MPGRYCVSCFGTPIWRDCLASNTKQLRMYSQSLTVLLYPEAGRLRGGHGLSPPG